MKFESVPMYSMGKRSGYQKVTTNMLAPGPGTYELRGPVEGETSVKFAQATRPDPFLPHNGPGPGHYAAEYTTHKVNKKHRIIKERSDKNKILPPGPGSYNISSVTSPVSFTISSRIPCSESNDKNNPGPATYTPTVGYISKFSSFSKAKRFKESLAEVPGPGAYSNNDSLEPGITFSKSQRSLTKKESLPGPGFYEISRELGGSFKSITGRQALLKSHEDFPGPGAYESPDTIHKSPVYSIGTSQRTAVSLFPAGPGPGAYSPSHEPHSTQSFLYKSVGKSFGKGKRIGFIQDNKNPGPGSYNSSSHIGEGPKHKILGRYYERVKVEVPGPSFYSPKSESAMAVAGTVKFGKAKRWSVFKDQSEGFPGPGNYKSARNMYHSPSWTFVKDSKSKEIEDDEPGPGHYELPPCIPDIPRYLLPGDKRLETKILN